MCLTENLYALHQVYAVACVRLMLNARRTLLLSLCCIMRHSSSYLLVAVRWFTAPCQLSCDAIGSKASITIDGPRHAILAESARVE